MSLTLGKEGAGASQESVATMGWVDFPDLKGLVFEAPIELAALCKALLSAIQTSNLYFD